jgi:arsenate reductase
MEEVVIWHNSRCSKSRNALNLLEEQNIDSKVYNYLESKPTKEQIIEIVKLLGINAKELLRSSEEVYKELNLKDENDENKLILAMEKNPILIQRPIIIKGNNAVIARPIENLELLLKKYM